MELNNFTVSFTETPSPSAPAYHNTTVQVGYDSRQVGFELSNVSLHVELRIDGDQSGEFRLLNAKETSALSGSSTSVSFYEVIDAYPEYDLQATAVITADEGEWTTKATTTIGPPIDSETNAIETDIGGDPSDDAIGGGTDLVDTDTVNVDSARRANVSPRIASIEPITMEARYQLPWDTNSNQTACGRTIRNTNGDKDWRIVIEGVLSIAQFERLKQLRSQADDVPVTTAEFGTISVSFDQLNVNRIDGEDVGEVDNEVGPLINFQLQTKENSESGS